MILLAIACLFMAGLNLWILFKDWFDKKYQKRTDTKQNNNNNNNVNENKNLPSIIGKSKYNLREEMEKERLKKQSEELLKRIEDLEKKQLAGVVEENNAPVHSMDLEKEKYPLQEYTGPVSSEEDIILHTVYDKTDAKLAGSQALAFDEMEMVIKSLGGHPVTAEEKTRVPEVMSRFQGTDMYEKLLDRIEGAKEVALAALNEYRENDENNSGEIPSGVNNDFNKYIRL